jgi:hypothetical protein
MSNFYSKINNIYIQRHAISCANIIEFCFNKQKEVMSKYSPDSQINYLGILQCLQVSDYLTNFRIDNISEKKPLLIFCCSKLIRTQQTLFLSWLKYLKDYIENNGKILIIDMLKEKYKKDGSIILNKDNYHSSLEKTKKEWKKFIENIKKNSKKIKSDTLNPKLSLIKDIKSIKNNELWDELFYVSKEKELNKIIEVYLIDQQIKLENYNGIELVFVSHFETSKNLIKKIAPSAKEYLLENCEIVKLPGKLLNNRTKSNIEYIFPKKIGKINNGFIFYISKINLFINIKNNNLNDFLINLKSIEKYIKQLEKMYKNKSTFYNYNAMMQKILENNFQNKEAIFQLDKLNSSFLYNYLFGFCGLDKKTINSIVSF